MGSPKTNPPPPDNLHHRQSEIDNILKSYREKIDILDQDLLSLLAERANCAVEIGRIKRGQAESVYNPLREKQILERVTSLNQDQGSPLPSSSVKAVFSEIISACRALQHNVKVAYLGPDGSFSHLAAVRQFGSAVELLPQPNINTAFQILRRGHCDYAVLPIENSIEGMVNNTVDQLSSYDLYINAELFLPIHLCLFVPHRGKSSEQGNPLSQAEKKKKLSKVKVLYSHPQPFGQARNWIEKHLPRVELRESHSTSHAAEECLKTANSACIGSEQLLKVFSDLKLIEDKIEDLANNTTRFVVIADKKTDNRRDGDNITSLMITIKDKPGALYSILSVFTKAKINLTNLVSRPSKKKAFDYLFYIDFEGDGNDPKVKKVLRKIEPFVVEVKNLGVYPRGIFF